MATQKPATLDLCRTRGDTFPFTVVISQGGAVVDITGYSIVMTVDPSDEPTDALNNLFTSTGTIPLGTDGKVTFALTALQADQTPGEYFHDMQLTDGGGNIRTFAKGSYLVEQDVTK